MVIIKSLYLALCSFRSSTGVEHKDNFKDVDYYKAKNSKIMQRSQGLPDLIDIVHTSPYRYLC